MANNVYDVLMAFDLKQGKSGRSLSTEVKEYLMDNMSYYDRFTNPSTDAVIYLPNTTLWKQSTTVSAVRDDVNTAIKAVNEQKKDTAELERFLAVEWTGTWSAIKGEPYSKKRTAPKKN